MALDPVSHSKYSTKREISFLCSRQSCPSLDQSEPNPTLETSVHSADFFLDALVHFALFLAGNASTRYVNLT